MVEEVFEQRDLLHRIVFFLGVPRDMARLCITCSAPFFESATELVASIQARNILRRGRTLPKRREGESWKQLCHTFGRVAERSFAANSSRFGVLPEARAWSWSRQPIESRGCKCTRRYFSTMCIWFSRGILVFSVLFVYYWVGMSK